MKQRIITGLFGATVFLFFLFLGGWWYTAFLFFILIVAFLEFCKMRQLTWRYPPVIFGLLIIGCIFGTGLTEQKLLFCYPFFQFPFYLLVGFILFNFWIILSNNVFHLDQMAFLFIGTLYIGYSFSFMMQTIWKPNGLLLSLLVIFVTWANDTGAYFIGKRWGKRKLWPDISPNKTIEGSLGGILLGSLLSLIFFLFFPQLGGGTLKAIGLGLVITIIGQIGDLIESAWKRTLGVKDSGTILPGHGGILDRFDSLMFTFIFLYIFQLL
jgi:phosphatidate cytidylyltransferase